MTWNRSLLLVKLKALGAHLSISILLVGIALWLMLRHWFPAPLFSTDGGGVALKLLLLVDLVLGPLLTFVVFNPQKARRLMLLDLGVIAVLQLAAYGAGLWSIHSVRVQAVAFHEGVFHAVTADTYKEQEIAVGSWQALGPRAPYLVDVREAVNGDEAAGVTVYGFLSGLEPYHLQFLYQPLAASREAVVSQGWTFAALQQGKPALVPAVESWARRENIPPPYGDLRFYRVEGFYNSAVLVLNTRGEWLGGFDGELVMPPASSSP